MRVIERHIHIYTMMCCLLVDLSALFVHINIYTRVQRTRQHRVQIDEKNIETTRTVSLSLYPLLLDSLPGFSHPSFFLLLRLEATTSITATTTITHTHTPLSVIIIINNNTSSERDERASEFLFRSQGKRGGNRLSWRCRRLFCYWAFYLFLSLLCVYGGQILFPVNCGGRSRFFPSSFHAHSHMLLVFFLYFIAKKKREIFSLFIHTYLF